MFFAPMFRPQSEIVIWGPAAPEASLEDRIARYISAPLSPVEVRELPCHPSFREATTTEWRIGPATIRAASVAHRGPTLAYRVDADGSSVCFIPDHEPGLGASLAELDEDWISGLDLARDAALLIHDCQYTDDEYPAHTGWGHSSLSDALQFGHRAKVRQLLLFHHDPLHSDDFLDALAVAARDGAAVLGRPAGWVALAAESDEISPVPAQDARAPVG